jgi:two-component system response regulator GlrR
MEEQMKSNPPPPKASLGFGITRKAEEFRYQSRDDESRVGPKPKILVVDADPGMRRVMATRLGAANYAVETVGDAQAALDACVVSRPNLVIADLRVKDADGLAFLKELRSRWPQLTVIILTAHGTISEAVQATQCGAFGYLVKPVEKEELLAQVQRATALSHALTDADWRANFALRSQLMEDRLGLANRAAGSDVPVLLMGDNGTGKELLARAIHAASARRAAPFVAVSCQAAPARAMEAELFGEEPDESGNAESVKQGALQQARGGTLFLQEIADLSMEVQLALAKALAKEDVPSGKWLGAVRGDVRLISTTSRDLKALTESGAFLTDLYYQVNILPIEIPPLGRRREDIPVLVSHFLEQATEPGSHKKIYSPQAIERLATTDWPGNVRRLFDLVKQNIALSHGEEGSTEAAQGQIPTYSEARDQFSRDYLAENLQRTAGNVTEAARLAKRSRTDFYKLLARHRLHVDDFKKANSETDTDDKNE